MAKSTARPQRFHNLTVRLTRVQYKAVKDAAKADDRPMAVMARRALLEAVERAREAV